MAIKVKPYVGGKFRVIRTKQETIVNNALSMTGYGARN